VLRAFDAPENPFGPGHRGIDVAAPVGTDVLAPASGVVSFAGSVAGGLFVTIDHGGGLRSTSSWVSELLVREGEVVAAGQPVARSGGGHPGGTLPHVHFGVRLDGAYVDPLEYLGPVSVVGLIHLAPLEEASG
jgi:murein DD-endopeptidase MepM/ murein hydrolase activator NlpD